MAIKSLQCPNCRGAIQLDDSLDTGICEYCNSLVQVNEKIVVEHVYNNSSKINNFITLADRAFAYGNFNECSGYCSSVLELDANNAHAVFRKGLCSAYLSFSRIRELDTAVEESRNLVIKNSKDPAAELFRMFKELGGYIRYTYDRECKQEKGYIFGNESNANRFFTILATLIRLCRSCIFLIDDSMIHENPALEGEKRECLKYAMTLCDRGGTTVKYIAGYETVQKGDTRVQQPIHKKLSSPFKDVQDRYYNEFKTAYNNLPTFRKTIYDYDREINQFQRNIDNFNARLDEYLQANPDIAKDYKQNPVNVFRRVFNQAKTRKQILSELPTELATLREIRDMSEERLRTATKAKDAYIKQNLIK